MTREGGISLDDDQRALLRAPDSRMEAYYFGFERTGVPAIDAILSAVAYAGKGSHSTAYWEDADVEYGPVKMGQTFVDVIQAAANEAAAEHNDLTQRSTP